MKKMAKPVLLAFCLVKLISTVMLFADASTVGFVSYTYSAGLVCGLACIFSDSNLVGTLGFLVCNLEAYLLPVFLLVGALTKKEKHLRISAIVLGALSLVDIAWCVVLMCNEPAGFQVVNLLFSLVIVALSVVTTMQTIPKKLKK